MWSTGRWETIFVDTASHSDARNVLFGSRGFMLGRGSSSKPGKSAAPVTRFLKTFAAALFLAILAGGPVASEARNSQLTGAPEGAQNHLRLAVSAAETDHASEAIKYAEELYRGSYPEAYRLRAALLFADLHASAGRFVAAKLWARRAYELSDNAQEREAIASLYKRIAAASPLSFSASLSFAPSSNVNNGGTTNVIMIGGYPFVFDENSLQLSGLEATGSLSMTYRLSQTTASRTEAFGDASLRRVWLEPQAAEVAPDQSNADFDQLRLAFGLRHSWQALPTLGPTSAALSFGAAYQALGLTSNWRMAEVRQVLMQTQDRALRVDVQLRADDRLDSAISSSDTRRIGGLYQVRRGGGLEVASHISVSEVISDSALVERDEVAAGISVSGIVVGPFGLAISVDAAYADFPKWVLTLGGRQDASLGVRIDATYGAISVLGFSPALTLSARRTESNLDIFDRSQTSIGLSFRSSF